MHPLFSGLALTTALFALLPSRKEEGWVAPWASIAWQLYALLAIVCLVVTALAAIFRV